MKYLLMCMVFGLVVSNQAPVFRGRQYLSVQEDAAKGTVIGQLTVVDPDGPEQLQVNTSDKATADLVSLGPVKTSHHNHEVTVPIILKSELDSDFHPTIRQLNFVAFDGETSATTTVRLQIQDVNDNAPQFTQKEYTVQILGEIPIGTVILIVTAVDPDPTFGGVVQYKLQTNDLFAYQAFAVNAFTGMITVKAPLVIKKGTDMHMQVVATDGGGLSSECNVTVSVH